MQSSNKPVTPIIEHLPRRQLLLMGTAVTGLLMVPPVFAQSVEARHWQGSTAATRQPEHVVATTLAEWRSLWSRVGSPAPDMFEAGRMNAVGIFLGRRGGEGYAVNILSTARRRDRIVVVFEERMPAENTIMSVSSQVPSENTMRWRAVFERVEQRREFAFDIRLRVARDLERLHHDFWLVIPNRT